MSYQFWSPLATSFEASVVRGRRPTDGAVSVWRNDGTRRSFESRDAAWSYVVDQVSKIGDASVRELVRAHLSAVREALMPHR